MKVRTAEFVKSAFERRHWPENAVPEIAFLGRSNVGKSSLINSLLQRKGLARTSNTPGRTQSINFFLINESFYFVDLPGYGFAKVSKTMRQDWGKMAEDYLANRETLALCIQLVDSRHKPTTLDLQLHEWLVFHETNCVIAATKSDKLSSNELTKQIRLIEGEMKGTKVIVYSSKSGKGRYELWSVIAGAMEQMTA
jgi:GTP-binding protein